MKGKFSNSYKGRAKKDWSNGSVKKGDVIMHYIYDMVFDNEQEHQTFKKVLGPLYSFDKIKGCATYHTMNDLGPVADLFFSGKDANSLKVSERDMLSELQALTQQHEGKAIGVEFAKETVQEMLSRMRSRYSKPSTHSPAAAALLSGTVTEQASPSTEQAPATAENDLALD